MKALRASLRHLYAEAAFGLREAQVLLCGTQGSLQLLTLLLREVLVLHIGERQGGLPPRRHACPHHEQRHGPPALPLGQLGSSLYQGREEPAPQQLPLPLSAF